MADKISIKSFFNQHGLKIGQAYEDDPRSVHYNVGQVLYDIPTTLNSLLYLKKRTEGELIEAVNEFELQLNKLIQNHRWEKWIKVTSLTKLPAFLA